MRSIYTHEYTYVFLICINAMETIIVHETSENEKASKKLFLDSTFIFIIADLLIQEFQRNIESVRGHSKNGS